MSTKLVPYVNFQGNAEEALNFYSAALGGEVVMLSRYGEAPMPCDESEKQWIMHARLVFGENMIMISDTPKNRPFGVTGNIQLSIQMDDAAEMETVFNKIAGGGTVIMPLADQFWGSKFGMLTDKFGVNWMFNCELKK